MAIDNVAIRNMLNMVRTHEALERSYVKQKKDQQQAHTPSESSYSSKINMPDYHTARTIELDKP